MSIEVIQAIEYWFGVVVLTWVFGGGLVLILGLTFIGFPMYVFRLIKAERLQKQQQQSNSPPKQLEQCE